MRSAYPNRAFCDLRANLALSIRSTEKDNEETCHGEITSPRGVFSLLLLVQVSHGQARGGEHVIKIGVLADMNGPLSRASGPGSPEAARIHA